ncbi:hypothetical protein F4808DRAFT_469671 [Astrocystis sublimbata]|nr:hypothetical protein F4808DRAFT_469671 [Astrocystis sublimbata]
MSYVLSMDTSFDENRKTEGHSDETWDMHYSTIRGLYLENEKTLEEVRIVMQEQYGFRATELAASSKQENLSLNILFNLLNHLEQSLGPGHRITIKARNTITALLRRGHRYEEALQNADKAVSKVMDIHGKRSLQARATARQLEHVYMDIGSWSMALTVCMDIVGQTQLDGSATVSTKKDECDLYTMEDVAKIHQQLGDNDQSISWLMLAATTASTLFGASVQTIHIVDKLEKLLVEQRRYDEAGLWGQLVSFGRKA